MALRIKDLSPWTAGGAQPFKVTRRESQPVRRLSEPNKQGLIGPGVQAALTHTDTLRHHSARNGNNPLRKEKRYKGTQWGFCNEFFLSCHKHDFENTAQERTPQSLLSYLSSRLYVKWVSRSAAVDRLCISKRTVTPESCSQSCQRASDSRQTACDTDEVLIKKHTRGVWLPTRGEKQQHKNNSAGPSSYCIQIHKKSETLTDDMMSYWVITMAEKLDVNAFKTCLKA